MKYKKLGKSQQPIPVIGQGCMGVGGELSADASRDADQVRALQTGIELGMRLIDTAEVYGNGHSEELVARAVRGIRDSVFIATKVSPENNSYDDVLRAADASLRRLQTDYIDLYQVHWPNPSIPIRDTMRAMCELVKDRRVRHVGLSNFSVSEIREARRYLDGVDIVSDQVEYNLFDRFIEKAVLPYCTDEGLTVIAYSPLDKGRFPVGDSLLQEIATEYCKTPSQIVLNWLTRQRQVVAIPKASTLAHVYENACAADFDLSEEDVRRINDIYSATPELIPVDDISVSVRGEGDRKVYQTIEQALRNELKFTPSPKELANDILKGEPIKPVRVIPADAGSHRYDLIEGRIRYWAWVIAYSGKRSIPALIRGSK
jgi:diketogulonate reductase-like aldo/keto reductase